MSAPLEVVQIELQSVAEDGRPLPGAYFVHSSPGYHASIYDIQSHEDGRATYLLLRGISYVFTGHAEIAKNTLGCMPETTVGRENYPSSFRAVFTGELPRSTQSAGGRGFSHPSDKGKVS